MRRIGSLTLLALAAMIAATPVLADQRDDFIAGKTKDCPGCDLHGINKKRADLRGANLAGANLKDADFHNAILDNANLSGADLSMANMNITELRNANLKGANLTGVMLYGARANRADFANSNLTGITCLRPKIGPAVGQAQKDALPPPAKAKPFRADKE